MGEDNRALFREIGYSEDEINAMAEAGVFREAERTPRFSAISLDANTKYAD